MCKFYSRRCPLWIVTGGSFIVALAGVIMIVIAVMFYNSELVENVSKEDEAIEDGRKFIFVSLVIFALFTIAIGLLGFCFCYTDSKIFACTYGLVLLPTWIFVLTCGIVAVAVSFAGKDRIEDECNKISDRLSEINDTSSSTSSDSTVNSSSSTTD